MRHIVLVALLIAGCASKPPNVEPIGNGRYTVTAESSSQASNAAAITRRLAMKQASRYCRQSDRYLNWEAFEDGSTSYTYTTKLTFSCR